ncbi:hypothetical protein DPEC_G00017570 [Dallia pectoralis]|uniref:Uncharacterized protein n=1 Tax=Dallia pectoralis TaxID=75939 RepID=A0ACC2HF43_DALPE|nr:hypothetical protein DPEC_G00017570 [Dallia pectoralis]
MKSDLAIITQKKTGRTPVEDLDSSFSTFGDVQPTPERRQSPEETKPFNTRSANSPLGVDGADLRPNLRLSRQSIQSLIAAVKPDCDHGWEKEVEVLVFLYWLARAASYRAVSLAFDIPKSTVHDIVHRMSKAVLSILKHLIAFPSADDIEAVGAGFAQLAGSPAFSVVAGAIDGCHVRVKPPASDVQCYFNRKLFNSVQLQAITDHQGKFLDIFDGYPGSVHDARVLKNCVHWPSVSTCRKVHP